jgi:hypothetical protein
LGASLLVEEIRRIAKTRWFQAGVLALITLVLRIASASGPYFSDAFRHIRAIESGALVVHAPGYLVFNAAGFLLAHALRVSAAGALQVLNIGFSAAGAVVFYLLVSKLPAIPSPFLLSLAYICSPIVWFSADVHSSYAAMTFFVPLLILVVEGEQRFVSGCAVWAVMTAFRPSDGAFVLPWMVFQAFQFNWKQRLAGFAIAAPLTAAWWLATMMRYQALFAAAHRSANVSPLLYSEGQAEGLAQGVLTGHLGVHALVNAFHAVSGMIMTWGLLTPFVCLGALAALRNPLARSMTLFIAPGVLFFLLYYVSDAPYFAFTAAPGLILAGAFLASWPPWRRQTACILAIGASLVFMVAARPTDAGGSRVKAVADAYFLKYSVPSLKEQKDPRLASLLGACHDPDVRGICR